MQVPDSSKSAERWQTKVQTGVKIPAAIGLLAIFAFIMGFGLWAASAPISGAAIASGVVAVSGQNQIVDHLEGGIVKEIFVREGARIKKGEAMVTLDETIALSNRARVEGKLVSIQAQLARAQAEIFEKTKIDFPLKLIERAKKENMSVVIKEQQAEFDHRLSRHKAELATLGQRTKSVEQEIIGLEIQEKAEAKKLELLQEEIAIKKKLLDNGLAQRSQYALLLREETQSVGRMGALKSTIAQRHVAIVEAGENITRLIAVRNETAAAQINELQSQIVDLEQQLRTRNDVLKRMVIRAPSDGIVIKLKKNTVGSVVRPGEEVMTILPLSAELVADVRVSPADVDVIRVGQEASLRFVSLNARITPEISARVVWVSADRFLDQATREPYFGARLKMTKELPEEISPSQIFPGMPVDVFIKTGDRTFLEYLARPIYDSFAKAFREE